MEGGTGRTGETLRDIPDEKLAHWADCPRLFAGKRLKPETKETPQQPEEASDHAERNPTYHKPAPAWLPPSSLLPRNCTAREPECAPVPPDFPRCRLRLRFCLSLSCILQGHLTPARPSPNDQHTVQFLCGPVV